MWEVFFTALGGSGVALLALGWFFRRFIDHRLNVGLEDHKRALDHEYTVKLEGIRGEIERDNIKASVTYQTVYEKQALSILELYKKIRVMSKKAHMMVYGPGGAAEKRDTFFSFYFETVDWFNDQKILYPARIEERVKEFFGQIKTITAKYEQIEGSLSALKTTSTSGPRFENLHDARDEVFDTLNQYIPEIEEMLLHDLRGIVGIR